MGEQATVYKGAYRKAEQLLGQHKADGRVVQ